VLLIALEVGLVPAAALEAETRRRYQPSQPRLTAVGAFAQRRVAHLLQRVEIVAARGTTIFVDRHTFTLKFGTLALRGPVLHTFDEAQAVAFGRYANRVAGAEVAAQNMLCERILQLLLDRPLQRPSAVHGVEPRL